MATKKDTSNEEPKDMQAKTSAGSVKAYKMLDDYVNACITHSFHHGNKGSNVLESHLATLRTRLLAAGANGTILDYYINARLSQMANPSTISDAMLAPRRTAIGVTIVA